MLCRLDVIFGQWYVGGCDRWSVLCRLDIFGQCYVGGCDLWSVLCRLDVIFAQCYVGWI